MKSHIIRMAGLASMLGGFLYALLWSLAWWAHDYPGSWPPSGHREQFLGLTADTYMRWLVIPLLLLMAGLVAIHPRHARPRDLASHLFWAFACYGFGLLIELHLVVFWQGNSHDSRWMAGILPLFYIYPRPFVLSFGLILYGAVIHKERPILPRRWWGVVFGLGVVYMVGFFLDDFELGLVGRAAALAVPWLFGLGWAWLGYLLWSEASDPSAADDGRASPRLRPFLALACVFAVLWLSLAAVPWRSRSREAAIQRDKAASARPRTLPTSVPGTFYQDWGSLGSGDAQFDGIAGSALAPDGTVYVADLGNKRIQYFSPKGWFQGKWSLSDAPSDVAVAGDGTVYVLGTSGQVQRFSPSGERLGGWSS